MRKPKELSESTRAQITQLLAQGLSIAAVSRAVNETERQVRNVQRGGTAKTRLPHVTKPPHLFTSVDVFAVPPPKTPQDTKAPQLLTSVGVRSMADLLAEKPRTINDLVADLDLRPSEVRAALAELPGVRSANGEFWIDKPEPVAVELAADRQARKAREEARVSKARYEASLKEQAELERRLDAALRIAEPVEPLAIKADPSRNGGEATALWLASDWHVEENVDPSTVNGLNKYNPEIAERRASNFFVNGLKLVQKERQDVAIDNLVLWLGGDLISGYIHDELEESNHLSPTEATLFAKRLIMGGLKMLKEDGEFKRITIITSFGNHGRTTQKRRVSTSYKNSFEWMLYQDLADRYASDEVIKVQTGNGYLQYLKVYDQNLRFHHGDNIHYQGGVGGVSIPLNKFVARTNQQQWATCDSIGHYHQYTPYSRIARTQINGSLIGFNAYAQALGCSPEPPLQLFQLIDSKRGFTISAPIFVE